MSQSIADSIKADFEKLAGISVIAVYMPKGQSHTPTTLQTGMCGVYVFLNERGCFKVGKAGPKSKARWNSHHYCLDETTPSTMPKSILKGREKFKTYFPTEIHSSIDSLDKANIQAWIKGNLSRIEFLFQKQEDSFALNLLEALAQFRLRPIFEGPNAQPSGQAGPSSGVPPPDGPLPPTLA